MKFTNKTMEPIKVEVENTDPKVWKTVKPDKAIEAHTKSFMEYYVKEGLTEVVEEVPLHKAAEETSEEEAEEEKKEEPKEEKPKRSFFGRKKKK